MNEPRDLLIEIGTEELPPRALRRLSQALADAMYKELATAELTTGAIRPYAAPRRLALLIEAVPVAQADRETVRRGPSLAAAFDDEGCPTRAATGFAASCGVEVEALDQLETKNGSWLAFRQVEQGQATADLIAEMVRRSLAALPIPRRMRWGNRDDEFVRPVHWVVLLFGDTVIDAEILGIRAGRSTCGHRFHHPEAIYITEPTAYLTLLENQGFVLADYDQRRQIIRSQIIEQAETLGGKAVINDALLDEVTSLVEWPVAIAGQFDQEFLQVPPEALISSMQDHQKYFPVVDPDGKLLAYFITVAGLISKDPAQIRRGNERVIRPRLADAAFFWNQDRKQPLAQRAEGLRSMVFQEQLGTLFDKQERIANLAGQIATLIGTDPVLTERAARLCKCDLLTSMVFEFPELQGVMGHYYALHDGEDAVVADAIAGHYLPRFAGDTLPASGIAQSVALADRLDSLIGIFAIGQHPSGDKDPFALRRAALGVVRICIELKLDIDLHALLEAAVATFDERLDASSVVEDVFAYIIDRLHGYYHDQGVLPDLIDAVLATQPRRLLDIDRRIQACRAFRRLPESASLAAANKRIANILRKTQETIPRHVDTATLVETAEKQLADELKTMQAAVVPLLDAGDYTPALTHLAGLRDSVDAFFDQVMVMVDDTSLRSNRLALLKNLGDLFLRVADLSKLQS